MMRRLRTGMGPMLLLALFACGVSPEASAAGRSKAPTAPAGLTGADLFIACEGCHALAPGDPHGVGPNLHGIDGRAAGSAAGFAYSPALAAADITWNRGTLTGWILSAETMVPGTWMLYHNHLEDDEVERLVEYLLAPR
jgi:cytochrome c